MNDEVMEAITLIMQLHRVQWSIGGKPTYPTTEDIKKVLDRLSEIVYDEGQQAETGGIIVRKDSDRKQVYLYIGEYNDNN